MIINESDHAIGNLTINRFAISESLMEGNEWIYTAINEFIHTKQFCNLENSLPYDLRLLGFFLKKQAAELHKSPKLIDQIKDKKLLSWIQSAIILFCTVHENYDYVILPNVISVIRDGIQQLRSVLKLLTQDGEVDNEAVYGNGLHQLLCASLNSQPAYQNKPIEFPPESQGVISMSNAQFIKSYLGIIWGSSATPGSRSQLQQQYNEFGFIFLKTPPHQPSRVILHEPIIVKDEDHFTQIQQILLGHRNEIRLALTKDIETCKGLQQHLNADFKSYGFIQQFTGVEDEKEMLRQAAKPNQLTIGTRVIGRNMDILYDRKHQRPIVVITFPASEAESGQMAGRTGREGSGGKVYFIFSESDMQGYKTLAEFQSHLDRETQAEYLYYAHLYDLVGYFLRYLNQLTPQHFKASRNNFLVEYWGPFSQQLESTYRQIQHDNRDQYQGFIEEHITQFNCLLLSQGKDVKPLISTQVITELERVSTARPAPAVYEKPVMMQNCVGSRVLAMLYFHNNHPHPRTLLNSKEVKSEEIKKSLATAMSALQNQTPESFDYLNLFPNDQPLDTVVHIHQDFITNFIAETIIKSSNTNPLWLLLCGSALTYLASPQCMAMFSIVFYRGNREAVFFAGTVKPLVKACLQNYLQSSRIRISPYKSRQVIALQNQIETTSSIHELIPKLCQFKLEIFNHDVELNKTRIKPVNITGSRLQRTLTQILNLLTAFYGEKISHIIHKQLSSLSTPKLALEFKQPSQITTDPTETPAEQSLDLDVLAETKNKELDNFNKHDLLQNQHSQIQVSMFMNQIDTSNKSIDIESIKSAENDNDNKLKNKDDNGRHDCDLEEKKLNPPTTAEPADPIAPNPTTTLVESTNHNLQIIPSILKNLFKNFSVRKPNEFVHFKPLIPKLQEIVDNFSHMTQKDLQCIKETLVPELKLAMAHSASMTDPFSYERGTIQQLFYKFLQLCGTINLADQKNGQSRHFDEANVVLRNLKKKFPIASRESKESESTTLSDQLTAKFNSLKTALNYNTQTDEQVIRVKKKILDNCTYCGTALDTPSTIDIADAEIYSRKHAIYRAILTYLNSKEHNGNIGWESNRIINFLKNIKQETSIYKIHELLWNLTNKSSDNFKKYLKPLCRMTKIKLNAKIEAILNRSPRTAIIPDLRENLKAIIGNNSLPDYSKIKAVLIDYTHQDKLDIDTALKLLHYFLAQGSVQTQLPTLDAKSLAEPLATYHAEKGRWRKLGLFNTRTTTVEHLEVLQTIGGKGPIFVAEIEFINALRNRRHQSLFSNHSKTTSKTDELLDTLIPSQRITPGSALS